MNVNTKLGLFLRRVVALSAIAAAAHAANAPSIPLCPGLIVVTAISQANGDYESIKTLESVKPDAIRVKYSAESGPDLLDVGPPLRKTLVYRNVLAADLRDAKIYEQVYLEKSAETFPGTTAIGVSAAVLNALKTKGQAELTLSNVYSGVELTADRNIRPNYMDYLQPGRLQRVGTGTVPMRVLVNDEPVDLPAIKAEGEFDGGDKAEFYFLDDERNPLTLAFRLGIGFVKPLDAASLEFCETQRKKGADPMMLAKYRCDKANGGDRDTLRVIKISYRCAGALPPQMGGGGSPGGAAGNGAAPGSAGGAGGGGAGGGGAGGASAMEQALAKNGKVDVYSIYFSFNSDVIREESEPTLREIAQVMARHPDWKLRVNGHTDAIGGDAYNLTLSKKRSAAVMDALVKRYHIDVARLSTDGFGRAQPKDTNDTLEGRARNRRVELMRQ